jgi:UDP-2,3-diacylglucosamine pyrophosphatase LpxH
VKRVAVIADAHVGGPGGAVEPLLAQLDELPAADCELVVFLGDMFQVWVGLPRFETAEIRAFLGRVTNLRQRGLRTVYLEGNRDFFIASGCYATAFDVTGTEFSWTDGERRLLFVHGDGLNERDRKYRFWRWLSKSAPVRAAMRGLPATAARRLVARTERGLADTNFRHKTRIPEEAVRRYASGRIAEGHDLVVLGHFHAARTWRVNGGEVRLLDAWFRSRRVEWV